MKERIVKREDYVVVVYSEDRWRLLKEMRREAMEIMAVLRVQGLNPLVHGSLARGDVKRSSDIDIVIPSPIPPYIPVLALERKGIRVVKFVLVQATPSMTPKLYIVLDEEEKKTISIPLAYLGKREYEFYFFGGAIDYEGLLSGKRVPGVDKRLVLVEPVPEGHREISVIGREGWVAKRLGISFETVAERVRVLSRREEYGRTGVFLQREIPPVEGEPEKTIKEVLRQNKFFRRVLEERGSPIV